MLLCAASLVVSVTTTLIVSATVARASYGSHSTGPSALVVFLSSDQQPLAGRTEDDAIERELASIPTLSIGILSATQGSYTTAQFLLDTSQGARVSNSAYNSPEPPFLALGVPDLKSVALPRTDVQGKRRSKVVVRVSSSTGAVSSSAGSQVQPWPAVLAHARSAPQLLDPGLLAARIPGGGGYIPAAGVEAVDGAMAADRSGHVAEVLTSSSSTLRAIADLQTRHRLVVADLPSGAAGYADLRALATSRPADELLIVLQHVTDEPNNTTAGQTGHELLWIALAGLPPHAEQPPGHALTSQTTNQNGLVAAIDIAPTILDHLGLPIPDTMRGRPIHNDGDALDSAGLRALKARLGVISSRRLPAVAWLVGAWALLVLGGLLLDRFVASPPVAEPLSIAVDEPRAYAAWAMRVGALALMWTPVAVLLPAALMPSRTTEFALLVSSCFALGVLTDRLLPWPRAPLAPAIAAVLALTIDALTGTQLLIRSLLGPNPEFGARFYGIGNELKSGLAVLVFTAVAAALYPAVRSRRAAAIMAGAGVVLAIVEGSARIGAGVGGVILVSAGTAVATVMLLPGSLDRKRALSVMAAPVIGLIALAALDLATAHGGGHFTGSVLDARSTGDIRDIIVRRYTAAWDELKNHLMPFATALGLFASALAVRRRERVCAPVDCDPAWLAALSGGLAAGLIGALTEDSGPVLFVVAVFVLGCVLSYLWGKPAPLHDGLTRRSRDTRRARRSRALTRSAAPSG